MPEGLASKNDRGSDAPDLPLESESRYEHRDICLEVPHCWRRKVRNHSLGDKALQHVGAVQQPFSLII
jgi:hypothetical protein